VALLAIEKSAKPQIGTEHALHPSGDVPQAVLRAAKLSLDGNFETARA
jgi:hypothetical protein